MAKSKVDHSAVSGSPAPPPPDPGSKLAEEFSRAMANTKEAVERASATSGEGAKLIASLPPPALSAQSPLALVERGRKFQPPRLVIYGIEGVGKSTLASKAPTAIFVSTEDGLGSIDCEKFPLARSYRDVVNQLTAVATEKHDYNTIVIDSLDWLEKLIWQNVCERCGSNHIEKVAGGFAKGLKFALVEWKEILDLLTRCRERGMCVLMVAHSKIENVPDPEQGDYSRTSPRLHKDATAMIVEWCDCVLYATRRLTIKKEGDGFNERGIAIPVGTAGGERVLRTVGSPGCMAKNRYSLPAEMPLAWEPLMEGISSYFSGK